MNFRHIIMGAVLFVSIIVTSHAAPIDSVEVDEVVVTGTRNVIDVRHLPQTVTVVGREKLTEHHRVSVLPTLSEQVPGL
ncbi:MAG: TonB-dependent receptor, partial [Bacteroidaceae bacterium]